MREFNEVPHIFRRRMFAALPHASNYMRQFPSPMMAVVGRAVSFMAGAFLALLLLVSLVDDALPLHVTLANRNLLWYIALLSGVVAVGRGLTPDPEDSVHEPSEAMAQLIPYTHYLPDHWRGRCGTFGVRQEFGRMYVYRIYLFSQELLSVLLVPFVLLVTLPASSRKILDFVEKTTIHVPELGAVCKYSLFEVDDSAVDDDGSAMGGTSTIQEVPEDEASEVLSDGSAKSSGDEYEAVEGTYPYRAKTLHTSGGKLQKSVLSFAANYPRWNHIVHKENWFTSPQEGDRSMHKSACAASGCGTFLSKVERHTGYAPPDTGHRSPGSPISATGYGGYDEEAPPPLESSDIGRSLMRSQNLGTGIDERSASIRQETSLIGAYISSRSGMQRRGGRNTGAQSLSMEKHVGHGRFYRGPQAVNRASLSRGRSGAQSVELTSVYSEKNRSQVRGRPPRAETGNIPSLSASYGNAVRRGSADRPNDPKMELNQDSRLSYGSFTEGAEEH
eukprot:gb/GECG01014826.1/.p1 GENE.gb/GECG01014826.1/~~gb/GECG01014826.1/.p1  ORF type:complete len:503 (+),score=56.04 gb/GECG01014826.1/:1-1509(+)